MTKIDNWNLKVSTRDLQDVNFIWLLKFRTLSFECLVTDLLFNHQHLGF
jgi:hypothetical protein